MSLMYTIDVRKCRVTVVVTALPTFEDFVNIHEAFIGDPAFKIGMDILWDRRAYRDAPDRDYIERVVSWWRVNQKRLGGGNVATVVPEGAPAAYGMARMAEALGRPEGELRVFTDIRSAIRWLDERFESANTAIDQRPSQRPT